VSYKDADRPDFLALSYVWGNVQPPTFPGSFTIGDLPATLEDAIELVTLLGQRYLWADFICIDQSSHEDKEEQIALMDYIYAGSWLTIVALSGTSVESGLPRVRKDIDIRSSQICCTFSDVSLFTTGPTLSQQIARSRWGTRAWTFQEAILSPRCLYLTEEQAYFECNYQSSCESIDDLDSVYPRPLDFDNVSDGAGMTLLAEYGLQSLLGNNPVSVDGTQVNPWSSFINGPTVGFEMYKRTLKKLPWLNASIGNDIGYFDDIFKEIEKNYGVEMDALSECSLCFKNHFMSMDAIQGKAFSFFRTGPVIGLGIYGTFLKHYSRLRMSNDVDSINAFGGVLKQLEKHCYRKGFFMGIPIEDLLISLMWEHRGSRKRRAEFPAWSWAGWEGELQFAHGSWKHKSTRHWQLPYFEAFKTTKGQLEALFLAKPSEVATEAHEYNVSFPYALSRDQLPYDPIWELSQVSSDDPEFEPALIAEGEQRGYLFLNCITMRLIFTERKGVSAVSLVKLDGVDCNLCWHSKGMKLEVEKRIGQKQDFIIIQRHDFNMFELLMVDIDKQRAARVTTATLELPENGNVESDLQLLEQLQRRMNGIKVSIDRARVSIDKLLQMTRGRRDSLNKTESLDQTEFERHEFQGRILASGAQLRRRRLALI